MWNKVLISLVASQPHGPESNSVVISLTPARSHDVHKRGPGVAWEWHEHIPTATTEDAAKTISPSLFIYHIICII